MRGVESELAESVGRGAWLGRARPAAAPLALGTHPRTHPPSSPLPTTQQQVVGFDSAGGKKFLFEGELTADGIASFAEAVADGTAKKFFKSGEGRAVRAVHAVSLLDEPARTPGRALVRAPRR